MAFESADAHSQSDRELTSPSGDYISLSYLRSFQGSTGPKFTSCTRTHFRAWLSWLLLLVWQPASLDKHSSTAHPRGERPESGSLIYRYTVGNVLYVTVYFALSVGVFVQCPSRGKLTTSANTRELHMCSIQWQSSYCH